MLLLLVVTVVVVMVLLRGRRRRRCGFVLAVVSAVMSWGMVRRRLAGGMRRGWAQINAHRRPAGWGKMGGVKRVDLDKERRPVNSRGDFRRGGVAPRS